MYKAYVIIYKKHNGEYIMENIKPDKASETLTVFQKPGVFCYGTDAVMLAKYVIDDITTLSGKNMCDLCTGTGIVPLLLCDSDTSIKCTGFEINTDACKLAEKSAQVSSYADRFNVICGDVKNYKDYFVSEQFDFLTCNPPYMTADCGKMCTADYKTIARHEVLCTLDDIFKAASYMLGTGGDFYLVYRTDRLASLFNAAQNNNFQIKKMTLAASSDLPSKAKLALCKAKKGASEGLQLTVSKTDTLCGK